MTAPLQVIALSFSRDAGSEDRILAEVDRLSAWQQQFDRKPTAFIR